MRFWEARSARRGGELMRVDMLLVDVNAYRLTPVDSIQWYYRL